MRPWKAGGAPLLLALVACGDGASEPDPPDRAPVPAVSTEGMPPWIGERIEECRQVVLRDPESATAWGEYGKVLDAHRLSTAAAEAYARAQQLDPAPGRWAYLRARILHEEGSEEALELFARATREAPDRDAVRISYGKALLRWDRLEEARREFEAAARPGGPSESHARLGLAQVAEAEGRLEEAVAHLEAARAAAPLHRDVHSVLSALYGRLGRREEAKAALEQSRQLDALAVLDDWAAEVARESLTPSQMLRRGKALEQAGSVEQALGLYRQLLSFDPRDFAAQHRCGVILAQRNQDRAALAHLRAALELRPDDALVLVQTAHLEAQLGETEAAVEKLVTATQADPELLELVQLARGLPPALRSELFRKLHAARAQDAAVRLCRAVLQPKEEDVEWQLQLADSLVSRPRPSAEQIEEALGWSRRVTEDPEGAEQARAWLVHSIALFGAGRTEPAEAAGRTARGLAERDGQAGLLRRIQRHEEAMAKARGEEEEDA